MLESTLGIHFPFAENPQGFWSFLLYTSNNWLQTHQFQVCVVYWVKWVLVYGWALKPDPAQHFMGLPFALRILNLLTPHDLKHTYLINNLFSYSIRNFFSYAIWNIGFSQARRGIIFDLLLFPILQSTLHLPSCLIGLGVILCLYLFEAKSKTRMVAQTFF